jgi:D-threo-aldose 1-dehydrogenase
VNTIALPGGGRRTTQLGFGCAYITPENVMALDAAYDAGIRHFDVARSYGRGLTEGMLGRFLKRHRAEITITSKYGIRPPFSHPLHAAARAILKPIVRRVRRAPIGESRLGAAALSNQKATFSGTEATSSLNLSLRNLGVERLDLFLMHEPESADLADPSLLAALQAAVRAGKIGAFGVAGVARNLDQLLAEHPGFGGVLQYDWTALHAAPTYPDKLNILYRVHAEPARRLRNAFLDDAGLALRWSDAIGRDLAAPGQLEQLLLRAALTLRPDALVLFSSTKAEHIHANVLAASDASFQPAALKLAELMSTSQPPLVVGT